MLREALDYLFQAGRAAAPSIVTCDAEPNHIYFKRHTDGSLLRTTAEPAPDDHTALSLQAIIAIVVGGSWCECECWYSANSVTLRYGDERRNRVTLKLILSDQLKQLAAWRDSGNALNQAQLISILRTKFRDSLAGAGNLIESLRKVKFNTGSQINSEVGHGKASLGKELMGEVTGLGAIPEYVTFDFPVFANACFRTIRASVECALEPDASTGTFRLIPLPGRIELATDTGVQLIGDMLRKQLPEGTLLLHGSP